MTTINDFLANRVPEGERNQSLFVAACAAWARGGGDMIDAIRAKAKIVDGLPDQEIEKTIESARRAVESRPRPPLPPTGVDEKFRDCPIDKAIFMPINGARRSDDLEWPCRWALVECDDAPLVDQGKIYTLLRPHIRSVVYSGGKSIHYVVDIGPQLDRSAYATTVAQLYAHVREATGLRVDEACGNPERLTRVPGAIRPDTGCDQVCIYWADQTTPWTPDTIYRGRITRGTDITACQPRFVVHGWVPERGRLVLTGPSKGGKSCAALQLAAAVSTGSPWWGRQTEPVTVLYVAFEADPGMVGHVWDAAKYRINRQKVDFFFARGLDPAVVCETVEAVAHNYAMIVIDPLYFMVGDENDGVQMKRFLAFCDRLPCAVVVVHHTRKTAPGDRSPAPDRAAGHGSLVRWADTVLVLTRTGDEFVADVTARHAAGTRLKLSFDWPHLDIEDKHTCEEKVKITEEIDDIFSGCDENEKIDKNNNGDIDFDIEEIFR